MIRKTLEPHVLKSNDQAGYLSALASVTNNLDHQHDVIVPGAWAPALSGKKAPLFTIDHKWEARSVLGKITSAVELMPNDPRLPPPVRDAGYGGLLIGARFNLDKQLAREAYSDVKAGNLTSLSVGFNLATDASGQKAEETRDGIRYIKSIASLHEVSLVFLPANELATVMAVKCDGCQAGQKHSHEPGLDPKRLSYGYKKAYDDLVDAGADPGQVAKWMAKEWSSSLACQDAVEAECNRLRQLKADAILAAVLEDERKRPAAKARPGPLAIGPVLVC